MILFTVPHLAYGAVCTAAARIGGDDEEAGEGVGATTT